MSAQLIAPKPTIKILLYTDNSAMDLSDTFFGLQSMHQRLHAHAPTFAKLETTLVCRSSSDQTHADNKINVVLDRELQQTGQPFDEIWFFGLHQANQRLLQFASLREGPNSELDANEVAALEQWMSAQNGPGGGVLMTGDHANSNPFGLILNDNSPCGAPAPDTTFMGLGRAIGRCVPRAGALRIWEGPPTREPQDSFSTLASLEGDQGDRFPQQLTLRNVNADGDPDENGQPHPLFFYRQGQFIRVFPDHHHEGAVVIPDVLDPQQWPNGPNGQVRPQVVARGTDKRRDTSLNIIATYNGDLANVGRIVADSTWHHYTNANLGGFFHPSPIGSEADQIGQFYGNLAVWLAPRSKRLQMARAMTWELSRYTLFQEATGDPEHIGVRAYSMIDRVASACEINELLQVLPPAQAPALEVAAMSDASTTNKKLFLGFVLHGYHEAIIQAQTADPEAVAAEAAAPNTVEKLIETAFKNTLDAQETRLRNTLDALSSIQNNN